jgi:hypothetical protein
MIFLIHPLEHFGVPSGAAIAIVIAGKKLLKGGTSKIGTHRNRYGRLRPVVGGRAGWVGVEGVRLSAVGGGVEHRLGDAVLPGQVAGGADDLIASQVQGGSGSR